MGEEMKSTIEQKNAQVKRMQEEMKWVAGEKGSEVERMQEAVVQLGDELEQEIAEKRELKRRSGEMERVLQEGKEEIKRLKHEVDAVEQEREPGNPTYALKPAPPWSSNHNATVQETQAAATLPLLLRPWPQCCGHALAAQDSQRKLLQAREEMQAARGALVGPELAPEPVLPEHKRKRSSCLIVWAQAKAWPHSQPKCRP